VNRTAVDAYRYLDYRGATNSSRGMGAPGSIFQDVQTAAVGWIQNEDRQILLYKDEGEPLAQNIFLSEFSFSAEYAEKVMALQKVDAPKRLSLIDEEREDLTGDQYFPGYRFWTGSASRTKIENFKNFWGIHESGLIVSGEVSGEFHIGENHYLQFPLLILEDGPWVRRIHNWQDIDAIDTFVAMVSETGPQKAKQGLARLEERFIRKYPQFESGPGFLSRSSFSDEWKERIIHETEECLLKCGPNALALIMPMIEGSVGRPTEEIHL